MSKGDKGYHKCGSCNETTVHTVIGIQETGHYLPVDWVLADCSKCDTTNKVADVAKGS